MFFALSVLFLYIWASDPVKDDANFYGLARTLDLTAFIG